MFLNVCTVTRALVHIYSILWKAHSYWSSNHTQSFSAIRTAVPEKRKRGAHVSTCTCTPPLTFVNRQANGSLTTNQILEQSVQPFPRYRKGGISAGAHVRTCRCTPLITCVICIAAWSPHTKFCHYRSIHFWVIAQRPIFPQCHSGVPQ